MRVFLLKSRDSSSTHPVTNDNEINLFTKEIYNRYTNFMLSSEDALSELWEYYLLDGEENFDSLSDVIRTIFSIGEVQIRLGIKSSLFVEESEGFKFFTVTNIDEVPLKVIELLLKKNEVSCDYKIVANKLSFKLTRIEKDEEVIVMNEAATSIVAPSVILEESIASQAEYTSASLKVYDYIDEEDMSDLEEYAGRLSSLMLIVGTGDVSEDEAITVNQD